MGRVKNCRAETFSGWQWNNGTSNSFWDGAGQDWLVWWAERESLASVRSDYLQQIQKSGRTRPSLDPQLFLRRMWIGPGWPTGFRCPVAP